MEKIQYELEFIINTSSKLLYTRISTPSGLAEWFADDVKLSSKNYTFFWDGSEQTAELISKKANDHVKFHWLDDEEEDTYFEFKIEKDELTNDVALIVTDFAEEDELEESKDLWEQQISELRRAMGL